MINFVIAYKDTSPFINILTEGTSVTFRMWHLVDGSINIIFMFCAAFAEITVQIYSFKNASDFFNRFYYEFRFLAVVIVFKMLWLIQGTSLYMSVDF